MYEYYRGYPNLMNIVHALTVNINWVVGILSSVNVEKKNSKMYDFDVSLWCWLSGTEFDLIKEKIYSYARINNRNTYSCSSALSCYPESAFNYDTDSKFYVRASYELSNAQNQAASLWNLKMLSWLSGFSWCKIRLSCRSFPLLYPVHPGKLIKFAFVVPQWIEIFILFAEQS